MSRFDLGKDPSELPRSERPKTEFTMSPLVLQVCGYIMVGLIFLLVVTMLLWIIVRMWESILP